jgi:hypothetical protein
VSREGLDKNVCCGRYDAGVKDDTISGFPTINVANNQTNRPESGRFIPKEFILVDVTKKVLVAFIFVVVFHNNIVA